MGAKPSSFKKKLLVSSISSCILASMTAYAQTDSPTVAEEVIVLGVRGAQESAINTKRDATSIVDSISAEDIGKLPDVTIADSLQRITGIQIRRSAGEGANINIRGLPQVVTQLNGEVYLGAGSVTTVQPNFSDIPSQLFKGADVIKSPTASLSASGLTGTVDLKTRRPFDMDEGFTYAGGLELQTGEDSGEVDPNLNGLINWKGDKIGVLFAASYANVNLANYYNGLNSEVGWTSTVSEDGGFNDYGNDANGDDDSNDKFVGYQGFSAWNQFTERERFGLNGSFQADLGEGFQFTADWFHTTQDEYNRQAGLSLTNKWASQDFFSVGSSRNTGVDGYNTAQLYTVTGSRLKSFSQNNAYFSRSNNLNLELSYDNGGAFTATTRFVKGKADQEFRHGFFEGDLTDGTTTNIWRDTLEDRIADNAKHNFFPSDVAGQPGSWAIPNPRGYSEDPTLTIDYRGSDPVWSGFDNRINGRLGTGDNALTIREYLGDSQNYNQAAITSENNYDRRGDLQVFRFDGSLELADTPFVTSVDFGTRLSQRSASSEVFHLLTRFYEGTDGVDSNGNPNPDGCLARWKATDITFAEDCQVGEIIDGQFYGYTAIPYTPLTTYGGSVISVTDYGPVRGVPIVYTLDPKVFDDTEGFQRSIYNNVVRSVDPGRSYNVDLDEFSYYLQANFEHGIVSGNLGVRIVETDLTVKQNAVGASRSYGLAAPDIGDVLTKRDYRDVLPSLNVAVEPFEDLKFRFAYAETMTPLDLNQWGDAISITYALNDEGIQAVSGASQDGNPQLNPWRSKNYDVSAEWYFAPGSMASIGFFSIDVESFVARSVVPTALPDLDGVVRRTVALSTNVQGEGGKLEGIEATYRQSFDFLDGIWGNFGIDTNLTYSPSEQKNNKDIEGNKRPFQDNSELQYNLVGWYQGERFQARLAMNYRSERLDTTNVAGGLDLYQEETFYVDANASYDINDQFTVYVNASNITGEYEKYYFQWEDQYAFSRVFEPRLMLGVRARF